MQLDRGALRDFSRASKIEWLETNGTGAFAMGTAAGVNTRRYHALLVASRTLPAGRCVFLSRVEEEAAGVALGACQYPGAVAPQGYLLLEHFDSFPCATWTWSANGAPIEKQVYLIDRKAAVVIRYRAGRAISLRVRPFLAYRDYHSLGKKRGDVSNGLPRVNFVHGGRFEAGAEWYDNVEYLEELDRGLDFREDLWTPGVIVLELKPGEWSPVIASIEEASYAEPARRAEPFTIRRAEGRASLIAGYPWFTDWGRDAMISLPGLLTGAGRLAEAREVIECFLDARHRGVIPNRFPDAGESPQYNTADATLWMFQAVDAYLAAGGDRTFLRDLFYPAAKEILEWHRCGTGSGIAMDADHLLATGPQMTWMDTRFTPRAGKAVEINALWHGALSLAARWAEDLGSTEAAALRAEAELVRENFQKTFWNPRRECLFDLAGDASLRPNQILAVSLPFGLLDHAQQQGVVRAVHQELLTPVGLRTLERGDPRYRGRYEGGPDQRDAAYHQGTVWPWLLGPFVDAYLQACGENEKNLAYCRGLVETLEAEAARGACPDSISEIYDGDEPHRPRGCPAQAWSVAEMARLKRRYFPSK